MAAPDEIGGIIMFTEDITKRKLAEDTIRLSDERLRTLIAAISAIVWDMSAIGEFNSEQVGWAAFTGQAFHEYQGWGWLSAIHPDDQALTAKQWEAAVANQNVYQVEQRVLRADGDYREMSVRAVPVLDAGGSIREWVGVHTDVTDQKRAETAVRASEERFQAFMNHMPATAFIKDATGRYLYTNSKWRKQFDPEPTDWQGKTDYDFWPGETADLFRASDLACLTGGESIQTEETARTPSGEENAWLVMKFPLGDDGRRLIGGMAWDITDRRRAEAGLVLRDRAMQAATQGLMIVDANLPDRPVIYTSPGVEKMTGYPSAEFQGRNCRFLQGQDTDPAAIKQLRDAIRTGQACMVEILNYRKDGTPFWNELSISPVRDAAGRLTHFVGVQTDVTARRALGEQYQQAQKMEAFGQLAGGVAHDFNNLLTIINGYSEILLEQLPVADESRPLVAEIHIAGERSAGLTRQLLAFSRRQVMETKVLDLNMVVGDTANMLRRLIGEDVRLAVSLAPGLWAVRADPGQMEQVLMNLAVNARDAMPTGGRLTIETRNVELDEEYARTHQDARPGRHVLLSVSDTGYGIPPEVLTRIFEPFFTTKPVGQGTGLGLATLYGIVKQSGGHIAVYSEVGIGTTFKVYLPRVVPEDGTVDIGPEIAPPPRGSETILLVEDESGVRTLVRRVLEGWGYTVLEAENGEAAVATATRHAGPIHLLVTDVVMPGAGGRAVAERVAQHHPDVRVLFVSGYTDDAVIRHGVLSEGVNFLQKPFTAIAMAVKVRAVLDAPTTVT